MRLLRSSGRLWLIVVTFLSLGMIPMLDRTTTPASASAASALKLPPPMSAAWTLSCIRTLT